MKFILRSKRRAVALAAACLGLLALAGCRAERGPADADDHDDDHAGHVVPAHKPKDFPEAVRALRTLNGRIGRGLAGGDARALVDDETLPHALDIANWLPEIAADGDMPESLWDRVDARSGTLVADYRALLAVAESGSRSADTASVVKDADRAIADLEALVAQHAEAEGARDRAAR